MAALRGTLELTWTHSDLRGGPVDELLGVAVERPALDQLVVEVGRTLEDRARPGQVGDENFDKYLFEAEPALLREVADAMVALLPECDMLAGMEMGGIPIATVMSQLTGLPTVFVRKQAKEYGTGKAAEGGSVNGRRVVVIEDVVTTGGALLASCRQLRADGALIDTVVCAIDRDQGGRENLAAEALRLRPALSRRDLESAA